MVFSGFKFFTFEKDFMLLCVYINGKFMISYINPQCHNFWITLSECTKTYVVWILSLRVITLRWELVNLFQTYSTSWFSADMNFRAVYLKLYCYSLVLQNQHSVGMESTSDNVPVSKYVFYMLFKKQLGLTWFWFLVYFGYIFNFGVNYQINL